MARIRNSMTDNVYGGGKEQILTTDDGRSYVIKNSATRNVYGDGHEKIIVERDSSGVEFAEMLIGLLPKFIRIPIYVILIGIFLYAAWMYLSGVFGLFL